MWTLKCSPEAGGILLILLVHRAGRSELTTASRWAIPGDLLHARFENGPSC